MKSLLVDALRQAQGNETEPQSDVEKSAPLSRISTSPDASTDSARTPNTGIDALGLLATGQFVAGGGDLGIAADAHAQDSEFSGEHAAASAVARSMADMRNESLPRNRPLVARIGRLTPLFCLLAIALTAALYLLVARFAALGLNTDLNDMSARVQRNDGATLAVEWHDRPATEINVFDRMAGPGERPAIAGKAAQIVPEVAHNASVTSDERREEAVRHLPVAVPAAGATDRAFSSVRAGYDAYRARDYVLAEEHYRQALAIEPNHHDALLGIAAVFQRTSRESRALETYEKLLALDPGSTRAAAAVLAIRGGTSGRDSESDLKVLLQRFPQAPHLHFTLGSMYAAQGRWPEAQLEFFSAHQLVQEHADYSYNLAVSMERLGDYDAAREYFEVALQSAGDNSNVDPAAISAHLIVLAAQLDERP